MNGDATKTPHKIAVAEAERLIRANMPAWSAVRVPLSAAAGGILREEIVAERDQPPFDRVTMDGIAGDSGAGPVPGATHPAARAARRLFLRPAL